MAVQRQKSSTLNSVHLFYQTIATASKIRFPSYPCYYFPSFLLIQIYNKLISFKRNPRFRVVPLPNKLYSLLTKREFFHCDHFCFVSDEVYDKFVAGKKLNWMNLVYHNENLSSTIGAGGRRKSKSPDIVQTILTKPNASILVPVLSVAKCQSNCIFVSENCYQNLCTKYRILNEGQVFSVQLQPMTAEQYVPRLATRATVFLIKNANELPHDVIDEILSNYFTMPKILYRNHTYEITLDEQLLGTTLYSQYFHIFTNLKKLFFRCVNLESQEYALETCAVVAKGATTLHQSTSINFPITRQYLDDYCFVSSCPWGLMRYYNELKSCVLPFVGASMLLPLATSNANSPSPSSQPKLLSNKIFPAFLLQGDRGAGKRRIVNSVAKSLGFQQYNVDCAEIISSIVTATEAKLKIAFAKTSFCEPVFLIMKNFELFGVSNDGREDVRLLTMFQKEVHDLFTGKERKYPIVLIALSNKQNLKPIIQSQFLETITLDVPNKIERFNHLQWMLHKEIIMQELFNCERLADNDLPLWNGRSMRTAKYQMSRFYKCARNIDALQEVADKTQGFLFGDLQLLFDNAIKSQLKKREPNSLAKLESFGAIEEFDKILNEMQSDFSDSLGAPKVPRVLWSDIGGLAKIKDEIQSSIGLPLKHVHLMGKNMRRSGILLYGPPGTGKTLVAKAVATECNLSFLSVQGPELLNMYVGQSEQNVREVFARARSAAPCVIFLDELDSLAPNRGASGDSGGVMDRVVSQLLAEMDDMVSNTEQQKQIFILAATNRPDLIDPALLRPGRFDKLFYVGPCITVDEKAAVLEAQMKKFNLAKGLKIRTIAEILTNDMTGADIYSICSNAWLSAVRRTILKYQTDETKSNESLNSDDVVVNLDDFRTATTKFVPSINKKDMEYFNKLRSNYSVGQ